jgi:hypothetical protein
MRASEDDSEERSSSSSTAQGEVSFARLLHDDENLLAEQDMTAAGLARSDAGVERVVYGSVPLLLGDQDSFNSLEASPFLPVLRAPLAHEPGTVGEQVGCSNAASVLMLPFSFWETEDKESPAAVARMLLTRTVSLGGDEVPLWERTGLPREAQEFNVHFRQLLGFEASESAPVQRLRVTERARCLLFGEARLWADTRSGDFAGRQSLWTDVHLMVFPHGAILSVTLNWNVSSPGFSLQDLRTWISVARVRSTKIGLVRGWTFAQHSGGNDALMSTLGRHLYAALFGGSCVSLSNVASWLVALPGEDLDEMRTAGFENCVHHTGACLTHAYNPEEDERNDGDGQYVWLRSTCVVELSLEEVLGLEWGGRSQRKHFMKHFMVGFAVLAQHCLSERITLEKLSYLTALLSRKLPTPDVSRPLTAAAKEEVRAELMSLAMMLARYRASMASDDCGGRADFRDFFQEIRKAYDVGLLKNELRGDLRDTLAMVESDRVDEREIDSRRERLYKKRQQRLEVRKDRIRDAQKNNFEILIYASAALAAPFLVVCAVFGMNNYDVPAYVPWGYVLLGCGVVSIAMVLVIIVNFNRGRPALEVLREEWRRFNERRYSELRRPTHEKVEHVAPSSKRQLRVAFADSP